MTKHTLYSLRHSSDNNFTITKFVDGEVESSYELAANLRECACPAGARPSCRHRQMAPMMLATGIIDSHWFWDFDLNRAVDFQGNLKSNFDAMQELAAERAAPPSEPESDLARWDRIINRPHELRKPVAAERTIDSVPSCGQENQVGRDRTATEIENTKLPPMRDPIAEHVVDRVHTAVGRLSSTKQWPHEVDAKPWRRL